MDKEIIMANVLSVVSYKIFPAKLGGQKGIALFSKYFSNYHTFLMVTVEANDPAYADYPVLNILSNSRIRYINPVYFFTLRNIIRKHKITHLMLEHPYYGWLGLLLKRFVGVKLIVHSHNIEAIRFKSINKWWWGILWNYERFVHRHADFTFCITNEDRQYMISKFNLLPQNSAVVTYGTELSRAPSMAECNESRMFLENTYSFSGKETVFLFNGTLDYLPNLEALRTILERINPLFMQKGISYKIIICGKNLPEEYEGLKNYRDKNIIYAGFVEDITSYFKGADVFLNPVTDGGGIKTKLVEALGYNLPVISTTNGAIGVDPGICNQRLTVIPNGNWEEFVEVMAQSLDLPPIPDAFFETFNWEHIAQKAANIVSDL